MIDLRDYEQVKALQNSLRATLAAGPGVDVMQFLEQICGWFDFNETDPNAILVAHGKRQVLATIKTLMDATAEQVVAIVKQKDQ